MRKLYIGGINQEGTILNSDSPGIRTRLENRFEILSDLKKISDSDFYLAIDSNPKEIKHLRKIGFPKNKMGVIAFEPAAVLPWQTQGFLAENFFHTCLVGRPRDFENGEYWPQNLELRDPIQKNIDGFAMIAAKKLSFHKTELYTLRRKIATQLVGVTTYGTGWTDGIHTSLVKWLKEYLIHLVYSDAFPKPKSLDFIFSKKDTKWVKDKFETLKTFRYALIIENSSEYASEKVIDALTSKCVPVYVGNPEGLPPQIVGLCVCARPDIYSVVEAMEKARSIDFDDWSERVNSTIKSQYIRELIGIDSVLLRIEKRVSRWIESEQ